MWEETFFETTVLRVKQPLDDGTKTGEHKLNDYNATDVRLFGTSKTCVDLAERIRERKRNATGEHDPGGGGDVCR